MKNHTGFLAILENGKEIYERNEYYDSDIMFRHTNWHLVKILELKELKLLWKGQTKAILNESSFLGSNPQNYFYSSIGSFDPTKIETIRIARKVGIHYKDYSIIFTVDEKTGELKESKIDHKGA